MRDERGSASIVVAGTLAVLLLMSAGLRDVAVVVRASIMAQTAADAASLAAVHEMSLPLEEAPIDVAARFASLNGATLLGCTCDPSTYAADVTVSVPVRELWFAPDTNSVVARAKAVVDLPV